MVFWFLCCFDVFFFFKQKTAYEMRISDWSSDVCSSDLSDGIAQLDRDVERAAIGLDLLIDDIEPGAGIEHVIEHERTGQQAGEIGRASCRERVCQYV